MNRAGQAVKKGETGKEMVQIRHRRCPLRIPCILSSWQKSWRRGKVSPTQSLATVGATVSMDLRNWLFSSNDVGRRIPAIRTAIETIDPTCSVFGFTVRSGANTEPVEVRNNIGREPVLVLGSDTLGGLTDRHVDVLEI